MSSILVRMKTNINKTRWLYCVECPLHSIQLEVLYYLCDCLSGGVQR